MDGKYLLKANYTASVSEYFWFRYANLRMTNMFLEVICICFRFT